MRDALWTVLTVARKDVLQRIRDRSAILMAVVAPLVLVFVLNATLGSANETTTFEFGVTDQDQSELSRQFVAVLRSIEEDGIIDVVVADDEAALTTMVDRRDLAAGYVIPVGFESDVRANGAAEITIIGDPTSPIGVSVAEAIGSFFAREVDAVSVVMGTAAATGGLDPADADAVAALAEEVARSGSPISLTEGRAEGRGFDITTYYAISLSVFFLFFATQFGVLSLMEERANGTLARLAVAPVSPSAVLIGKLASSFFVGVAMMIIMVVATSLLMGASWGHPAAVGVLIVLGVITAIAVASLVASFAQTPEQAGAYTSMAAVVLGLLGGAFFPVSQASGTLELISVISPHRWMLEGFRDVSFGSGLGETKEALGALVLFALIAGAIGLVGARRVLEDR